MEKIIKEMIKNDHITRDTQYNNGLKKLRENEITHFFGILNNDDVRYYLYCNGIGCWK